MTAKLDLRFRRPAPSDAEYELLGRLLDQRGRRLTLEGECRVDGRIVAEASGLFLATTDGQSS